MRLSVQQGKLLLHFLRSQPVPAGYQADQIKLLIRKIAAGLKRLIHVKPVHGKLISLNGTVLCIPGYHGQLSRNPKQSLKPVRRYPERNSLSRILGIDKIIPVILKMCLCAHGRGIQAHDPGYRLTQRIHDLRQTLRVHRVYGIERRPKIKAVEALSHLDSRNPVRGKDTILLPRLLRKLPLPSGDSA